MFYLLLGTIIVSIQKRKPCMNMLTMNDNLTFAIIMIKIGINNNAHDSSHADSAARPILLISDFMHN